MIYYNSNTINDWNFGDDNIIKVYKHGAVCYYKITSGDTPTPVQEPCFAVVDDISQYSDTEFEDVFNKADGKWYKLNNLNQYEQYGVYGSGRTITYYDGKLTIDGDYEYIYSGGSWVNVGEVSGGTIDTVWIDPPSTNNQNASFDIGHYWGEGYKMVFNAYLSGSYSGDYGSFWRWNQHTPIEFNFYSNGFYYDFHNPTSTLAPDVATNDYSWRIMKNSSLRNYENSQIFNVILTNGTVSVKLEETGAEIVNGSTSVSTQSWYNGLYQASLGSMNNQSKCHLSHIQVYNANDELVNDIKFVKNQGVTGAQEISAYDSVLNVTYNNTNSYTPSYHIVEESGGTTYPVYYDEIQDPPNNLTFSSMTEAESYECPWVGMKATIDGDNYVFSGDSQSGYEWVYNPQILPDGYTAVEYIQNSGTSYINTDYYPNQDTRIIAEMQVVTYNSFGRLLGAGNHNTANTISCDYVDNGNTFEISWGGYTGWTQYSMTSNYNKHTYDWNKNSFYIDGTLLDSKTYTAFTCSYKLGIFNVLESGNVPTSNTGRYFYGKLYSFKIYDNDTLVRDFVPAKRDSDSKYGLYDIVNDVFYISPNSNNFIGGNPV